MAKRCRFLKLNLYGSDRPNATLTRQHRQPAGSKICIFEGLRWSAFLLVKAGSAEDLPNSCFGNVPDSASATGSTHADPTVFK